MYVYVHIYIYTYILVRAYICECISVFKLYGTSVRACDKVENARVLHTTLHILCLCADTTFCLI